MNGNRSACPREKGKERKNARRDPKGKNQIIGKPKHRLAYFFFNKDNPSETNNVTTAGQRRRLLLQYSEIACGSVYHITFPQIQKQRWHRKIGNIGKIEIGMGIGRISIP